MFGHFTSGLAALTARKSQIDQADHNAFLAMVDRGIRRGDKIVGIRRNALMSQDEPVFERKSPIPEVGRMSKKPTKSEGIAKAASTKRAEALKRLSDK